MALTAGSTLLIVLLLVPILLTQSGPGMLVPVQGVVQNEQPVNQSTEPIDVPGRPY